MIATRQTQSDRIRLLEKQDLNDLRLMQRKLAKTGTAEAKIVEATDKFLKKRGIGEYILK